MFAKNAEIEQAKEAAPEHITKNASFMVWEEDRFTLVKKGSNEFVCLVLTDGQGRYEPSCLNAAAMKSVFPVYEYQAKMLIKGVAIEKIYKEIESESNTSKFPSPSPGALVYMMSPKNKFYDHFNGKLMAIKPHIMLYFPVIKEQSLGFNNKNGLPMFYNEYPHLSVVHIHTEKELSN